MIVTIGLIVINVVVYLLLEIMGNTESVDFMMKCGAVFPPYIRENGEYWRFFTATFMHFGMKHLLNNMVMLGAAGRILENALGKVRYLILYIVAGLGGSILSYLQMIHSGDYAVSAGASGAVFGIIGALVWIVIAHKGKYETLTVKGLAVIILLSLYFGIEEGNVDNWGHIGGLLAGFLICIIFYQRNAKKIDFEQEN